MKITIQGYACPLFPIGTPVDENGCPGTICPYYGRCENTKYLL